MVLIRDVELARRERAASREPTTIELGGEQFTLLPVIPMGASFELMDAPEPEVAEAAAARAIARFIREAVVDDDQPRWDQLLARREDAIDAPAIIHMGALVAEAYLGPPSKPSAGSSGGRRATGPSSRKRGRKAT